MKGTGATKGAVEVAGGLLLALGEKGLTGALGAVCVGTAGAGAGACLILISSLRGMEAVGSTGFAGSDVFGFSSPGKGISNGSPSFGFFGASSFAFITGFGGCVGATGTTGGGLFVMIRYGSSSS